MFKYVAFNEVKTEHTKLGFLGASDEQQGIKVNRFNLNIASIESEDETKIDELIAKQPAEINCIEITHDEFKQIAENSVQVKRIFNVASESLAKSLEYIKTKYPIEERETWGVQLEEALKYQETGNEADAPFLKTLADNEGDTLENFVNAVVQNNNIFKSESAKALSEKRKVQQELLNEIGIF